MTKRRRNQKKASPPEEKRERGRPTIYSAEMLQRAATLATQGLTDQEIADELGIGVRTLYTWCGDKPEFRQAIQAGKDIVDDRVERALFHRATGYSHPAVKIMLHEGEVITETYTQHYPPDSNAARLWLTNRRPDRWRDRSEEPPPANPGSLNEAAANLINAMGDYLSAKSTGALTKTGPVIEHQPGPLTSGKNGTGNGTAPTPPKKWD